MSPKNALILWIQVLVMLYPSVTGIAAEYHVSKTGNDNNPGTAGMPFLTIQRAANAAPAGDIITVHQGVYRENVNPVRGGLTETQRIIYQVAEGELVEIIGSEIIKGWELVIGSVWRVTLPNTFFGDYNPYKDEIHGDWFNPLGRKHHTGEVYLNGKSLWEAGMFAFVLQPVKQTARSDPEGSLLTWFCESDKENTFIYANFQGVDPNIETVEINVRRSCFYPLSSGVSYITVRGFIMRHAATQWAPPTAEQVGLIGTNWSKGWIIENNIISDSKCSGVTLGKHGDEFDNASEDTAEGYVETINRAIKRGWSKENIGTHIVRNNTIYNCEQTGICGSLGAVFSIIENNDIFNIWTKRQFTGAEMGGIKIHAAIDMVIRNNRLYNCGRGLWLDWMAQGTIVADNLLYENTTDDLFMEVNHGPYLIYNNFFLSPVSVRDWSEGGAYVHNLFAGNIEVRPQGHYTPYHLPHSTELAGLKQTECGDNRFYNNIFICGAPETDTRKPVLEAYRNTKLPNFVNGNVYMNNAAPYAGEQNNLILKDDPGIRIEEDGSTLKIAMKSGKNVLRMRNQLITSDLLGKALVTSQGYVHPDGTAVIIDSDFFELPRNRKNPTAGPVENLQSETIAISTDRWGVKLR